MAVSAWWAGDSIGKGITSGAAGGVAGSLTLAGAPWLSGAVSGFVASGTSLLYDYFIEGDQGITLGDVAGTLATGTAGGVLVGSAIGGIVKTPAGYTFKGLVPPRPGRPPNPFRTTKIGVKTVDTYRAFGFSGGLGASYAKVNSELGVSRRISETFDAVGWTLLELVGRLTPQERAQEVSVKITYGGIVP